MADIDDIIARVREELDDFPLINEPALSADLRALLDEIEQSKDELNQWKLHLVRREKQLLEIVDAASEVIRPFVDGRIVIDGEHIRRARTWLAKVDGGVRD